MQNNYLQFYLRCIFLATIITSTVLTTGNTQDKEKSNRYEANTINESVMSISDRSYITVTEGIGNLDTRLLFEANIAPTYFIRFGKNSKLGMSISPHVLLRMTREESFPILTPSYMPNIMLYWRFHSPLSYLTEKEGMKKVISPRHITFLTLKLNHHSNGQAGSFFVPGTTDVNFVDGNFSTNFMEVALNTANFNPEATTKFTIHAKGGYERHFDYDREKSMKEVYYWQSINGELRFTINRFVSAAFLFKHMTGFGAFTPKQSYDAWFSVRLGNYSDFSLFARYYNGPDYYNLRYVNNISQITFGLLAEPLNLPIFRR